jgi:hypothetical protein
MARENRQLIETLESEFARIRSESGTTEEDKYRTVRDMAEFLGADATLLSRYRAGERPVSRRSAILFAERLRRGQSMEEQRILIDRLLSAKNSQSKDDISVVNWFTQRGHKGFLMVVSFNEPPVLRTKSELVKNVALAVAKGLSYAIVYPFSLRDAEERRLPLPIQMYLMKVWVGVQDLYATLLTTALDDIECTWKEEAPNIRKIAVLKERLTEAAARIQIYKLIDGPASASCNCAKMPAIGYRLFYCRNHEDSGPGAPEIWQWNNSRGAATMLQRQPEQFEIEAIETLLYPIPQHYEEPARDAQDSKWTLPNDEDLKAYSDKDESTRSHLAPNSLRWEVAKVKSKNPAQEIDRIIALARAGEVVSKKEGKNV